MNKIVSLNPELNEFLTNSLGKALHVPQLQEFGQHLCSALRMCKNDAETQHVLRTLGHRLLSSAKTSPPQQVWLFLDSLLSSLQLSESVKSVAPYADVNNKAAKKTPEVTDAGRLEARKMLEALVAQTEEALNQNKHQGFKHVPAGLDELFELFEESDEIGYNFKKDLDDHLERLLPLYVDEPLPSTLAPVSSPQSLAAVRELLTGLLDQLITGIEGEYEHFADRCISAGLIEQDDAVSIDQSALQKTASLYLHRIRTLNLIAFDLLFDDPNAAADSALNTFKKGHPGLMTAFATMFSAAATDDQQQQTQAPQELEATLQRYRFCDNPLNQALSGKIFLSIIEFIATWHAHRNNPDGLTVALGLPLAIQPGFLLPELRRRLTNAWLHNAEFLADYPQPKRIDGMPAAEFTRQTVVNAIAAGLPNRRNTESTPGYLDSETALLHALQLVGRTSTLAELFGDFLHLCSQINVEQLKFGDGSMFDDNIADDSDFWRLHSSIFKRIRNSPNSGERVSVSNILPLNDAGVSGLAELYFFDIDYCDTKDTPAIIQISRAFYVDYHEGIQHDSYRSIRYVDAIRACLGEKLHLTASHLLCYFLVTQRVNALFPPKSRQYETRRDHDSTEIFGLTQDLSRIVRKLARRTPLRRVQKALLAAKDLHRMYNEYDNDSTDFFGESLTALEAWVREQLPTPAPALTKEALRPRGDWFGPVIHRDSGGGCASWPQNIYSRISKIEIERSFSMSGEVVIETDKPRDYPWVVSFHKVMESILRSKLEFLYSSEFRHWIERANPTGAGTRYEPFKVLRLLEQASTNPSKYQELVIELRTRGINITEAKPFFREYMNKAKERNKQAHDFGTLRDAMSHRGWILKNIHRALEIFSIQPGDLIEIPD